MKKFLLSIFAVLFAFAGVQAQTTKTYTYDFSSNANWVTTEGGSTNVGASSSNKLADFYYKGSGDKFNANSAGYFNASGYFLWGKSGKYIELPTYSGEKITKITATSSNYGSTSVKVGVYNDSNVVCAAVTWSSKNTDFSYDIPEEYQSSVLRLQIASSHNAQITKLVITTETTGETGGEGGGETPDTPVAPAAPTLTASCSFDDAMTVEITDVVEGATAYYSLNNETDWVAGTSVEITETTTVYAKVVKDGVSSTVVDETYTKNVVLEEGTMMITFATNATDKSQAATIDNFVSDHIKEHNFETTLTCSDANKCYMGVSGLKMSSKDVDGSFTLSLGGGYKVTSIIVRAVNYGSDAASVAVNGAASQALTTSLADYTFDVNSEISQIKVEMTKRGYIGSIMVVCQEGAGSPEPVAPNAPVLPASTTFEGSMMVEIAGIATDATVYYTTDESNPATSDTREEYTEPFEITATTTVKAVAVNEVGESDIAEATYTLVETITLSNCTVAELIAAYTSGNNIADDATVVGYIVGCVDGTAISQAVFGTDVNTNTNILLADDPYETNIDNCIPVQLPLGTVRDALNLVDNSGNYQKKVILTGGVEKYFGVAALKNTSAYEFVEMSYITITVSDAGWATLYLGASARIPSTIEAYTVTGVNNGWVSLTQVTGVIPANTGIIVKATAGEYKFFMGETATADVTGNLLEGTLYKKNIDEEAYVLSNVEGVVGLYKAQMTDGTWLNNANKAYLPASAVPNKSAEFYGFDWNGTTGVEEVTTENGNVKAIYDLTGRRVEAITAPGIYIVNGVKRVVR